MTDLYTQESGSKKKYLAPVIVMLLCMSSLTVAGYAYNATVINDGDGTVIEGLSLQLVNTDGTIVTDPMYDLEFALGTHTLNGRAIYGNVGFTAADTAVKADYDGSNRDAFAIGYYVDTQYRVGDEGAFADVTGEAQAITPAYKLIAENGASSAVTLTVSMAVKEGDAVPDFVGKIYIVVTEVTDETPKVATAYLKGTPGEGESASITLATGVTNYTVQAYFVADDFYVSHDDVGDLFDTQTCGFKVTFSAATA